VNGFFPPAVYGAMLAATVAGQLLGMAVDALALARHVLWVPLALSVVLEALVGARVGAARVGHRLTNAERARLSVQYTVGLAAVSIPLAGWIAASRTAPARLFAGGGVSLHRVTVALGLVLALAAACTMVRYALMTVFSWRRSS
jgi:hypothetical protein